MIVIVCGSTLLAGSVSNGDSDRVVVMVVVQDLWTSVIVMMMVVVL